MLDVAKISIKGQVTIPVEIRTKLKLKGGDKLVFIEKGGDIVLMNSNRIAFEEFQRDMSGVAEKAGLYSEQDVVALVKEVRSKMWEKKNANNA
jgi:AbrB family looped-hinge helix DNA binding protein